MKLHFKSMIVDILFFQSPWFHRVCCNFAKNNDWSLPWIKENHWSWSVHELQWDEENYNSHNKTSEIFTYLSSHLRLPHTPTQERTMNSHEIVQTPNQTNLPVKSCFVAMVSQNTFTKGAGRTFTFSSAHVYDWQFVQFFQLKYKLYTRILKLIC